MQDRPIKGWLRVAPEVLEDDVLLQTWADRGIAYVRTLLPM